MEKWMKKIKHMKTETWILLLLAGVLFLVISLPTGQDGGRTGSADETQTDRSGRETAGAAEEHTADYAAQIEKRVEEILSAIDGVGKADVMITLESSGETILKTDESSDQSTVEEADSEGGQRKTTQSSSSSQTVLFGSDESPYVTEVRCPKVTGIVVCAEGGGESYVKAEISEAMEALFDLPAHKIKVLKRVNEES